MALPVKINFGATSGALPNFNRGVGFAYPDWGTPIGDVRYVHSSGVGTSGPGWEPANAYTTIDSAVSACTANNGDVVVVLPGHAETITAAAAIDLDIAGIHVIGLGQGDDKPTITFGTATTATIRFQAKNVTMRNFRFVCNIDSLVKFIDVNKNFATIEDCDFITASTLEATSFINLATTFDYLTVKRCRFEQPTDPTGTDGNADTGCLYCVDSEYILFEDCIFAGNFETAIFHNRTTACKTLIVKNCYGQQDLSGAEPFQLVSGATGACFGGAFNTPAEAAATEATLVGTLGNGFFISPTTGFGNDGAAGGQGGIIVATAS